MREDENLSILFDYDETMGIVGDFLEPERTLEVQVWKRGFQGDCGKGDWLR